MAQKGGGGGGGSRTGSGQVFLFFVLFWGELSAGQGVSAGLSERKKIR